MTPIMLPSVNSLPEHMTTGDLIKLVYPDMTVDTALPQSFFDLLYQRGYEEYRGQIVWMYPDNAPYPLTSEAAAALFKLAASAG